MACNRCGAKKGHLSGCPVGDFVKLPKSSRKKLVFCRETWNNDNATKKHDGLTHACDKVAGDTHGAFHQCHICGELKKV